MAHIQIWNSIKSLRRKNDDPLNDCSAFDFSDELDDDDPRYSRMQAVASDDSTDTMVDISANGPHLGPLSDDESLLDRAIALRGTQTGPGRDPNRDPCDNCNRQRELLKQRKVKRQLFLAAVLYFLFMTGELIGGYVANSLAIMTDALHMLTDLSGIILTLLALWLSGKSPTKRFTFGFHRLEVLSAMFSVLLIYILMVFLLYEAVQRTIHMDYEINGDIMLITAAIGVAVNLIMGFLLNQTGHLHSHSHAPASVPANPSSTTSGHGHAHGSLAVRAAFVHALGDLVQSIGVLVAAYIIRFKPEYKIADPICTYVFSLLVAFTTFQIVRDTGIIVLEGVPKHLNVDRVKEELMKIEDVFSVETLHLWCLTAGKIIAVVHLQLVPGGSSKWEEVQSKARRLLLTTFGMHQCSIQLQSYRRDEGKPCANCQISSA